MPWEPTTIEVGADPVGRREDGLGRVARWSWVSTVHRRGPGPGRQVVRARSGHGCRAGPSSRNSAGTPADDRGAGL